MNRRDKIDYLLSLIKEKTDELLNDEQFLAGEDFTAEELLSVCAGIILSQSIPRIEYSSPVGRVDKGNVSFRIDDNIEIDISPVGDDYEEDV